MAVSEAVAARPIGPLRQYVRAHHGYRQRGLEPAQHLGMPSPYLTVIAHLIRDWQQFTGLAPTEWIAHEFRNFQALAAEQPASSTA